MITTIIGPPGCGKTTEVSRRVRAALGARSPEEIMIISLTRSAAGEIGSRVLGSSVKTGTLHSVCYGLLGRPKVVGASEYEAWSSLYPEWAISDRNDAPLPGDRLQSRVSSRRAARIPVDHWPEEEREFHEEFSDFCAQLDAVTFDDMIEQVLDLGLRPPKVKVIFVDEGQDLSTMEVELLKQWATDCDEVVVVGDEAQSIYAFRGADPRAMRLSQNPIVLSQSWRVPQAVHGYATQLISRAATTAQFSYKPTQHAGAVERVPYCFRDAEELAFLISRLEGEVAFMAATGQHLRPLVAELVRQGVPYRTPSLRKDPLRIAEGSPVEVLFNFLQAVEQGRDWSRLELETWAKATTIVPRGWSGDTAAMSETPRSDLDWLWSRLKKPDDFTYAIRVYRSRGLDALVTVPRLTVGTIHSMKGRECDHAIVAPDLTGAFLDQWEQTAPDELWAGRDALLRLFYVASTRPRRSLYLLDPKTAWRAADV